MSGSISPWPQVRRGDREHPVRTLQHLLRARGHSVAVDGSFGPLTDAAVRAFQQEKGLVVDGVVGRHTWGALIITVRRGSTGDAVRGVQEEFQFRNLSGDPSQGLAVDGRFGPLTEAAVRGFQQALHTDISSRGGRRDRRTRHVAGPGQRNAGWLNTADRCRVPVNHATEAPASIGARSAATRPIMTDVSGCPQGAPLRELRLSGVHEARRVMTDRSWEPGSTGRAGPSGLAARVAAHSPAWVCR